MAAEKTAVAILAEGAEETELVATVDVLRRAGINVTVAGLDGIAAVKCSRGISVCPDVSFSEAASKDYDIVFLPGGLNGVKKLSASQTVGELLKKQEKRGGIIAAICAAPLALKMHGIGGGKTLTSYPSVKDEVVEAGNYKYSEDKVVVDENLITSRGPGTAIQFALTIIEHVLGKEMKAKVASGLIFN